MGPMRRVYWLQIADEKGVVARFPAGGALEHDIVDDVIARLRAESVGWFVSQAKVEAAVRASIEAAILALKQESRYTVGVSYDRP
jgi:hypothetical protein